MPAELERLARRWAGALLPVYHRLPGPARHVAVSLRGWPLARLRRSVWAEDEARLGARLEVDPGEAAAVARARLRTMLVHAGATVPYWSRLFADVGFDPASADGPEALRRLPVLERETVRQEWPAFQSRAVADGAAIFTSTSGTTGTGLRVRATAEAYARTWAQQVRQWRWAGVVPGDWRVTLFGAEVAPPRARRGLSAVNLPGRQILLSAHHLAARHAERYRRLLERRPLVVEGFPSVLGDLAALIGPAPRGRSRARVVFTTGEALLPATRSRITAAFGAPVFDHYGQDEKVGFILECSLGTYHQVTEYGVLEVVDDAGAPVAPGVVGHLVWTGLVNPAMPLVRYRIGDEGTLAPGGEACRCGVRYPAVVPTLTRTGDSLRLSGGRRVSPRLLSRMLRDCRSVAAAQFVQRAPDTVVIRVEPAAADAAAEATRLARRLAGQLAGVRFEVEVVATLGREASAKRRLVVVQEGADAA